MSNCVELFFHIYFILYRIDLEALPLEHVEILNKIVPTDDEIKKFQQFVKDKKNPKTLPPNDKFLFEVMVVCPVNNMSINLLID